MSIESEFSMVGRLNMRQFESTSLPSSANCCGDVVWPCAIPMPSILKSIGWLITWWYLGVPSAIGSIGSTNHL